MDKNGLERLKMHTNPKLRELSKPVEDIEFKRVSRKINAWFNHFQAGVRRTRGFPQARSPHRLPPRGLPPRRLPPTTPHLVIDVVVLEAHPIPRSRRLLEKSKARKN